MGNCGGKPQVNESNLAPEQAKEEPSVVSETKSEVETKEIVEEELKKVEEEGEVTKVEDEGKKAVTAAEEEDDKGNKTRSLGNLFSEGPIVKDDKTEAEGVVGETAKADITPAESSTNVAVAAPVVATPEAVKTEEPVAVGPVVEKVEDKKVKEEVESVKPASEEAKD